MKATVKPIEKEKGFTPFKVELIIETLQEARGLSHLANECVEKVDNFIKINKLGKYSDDYSAGVLKDNLWMKLRDEIESQGFKI